MVSWVNIPSVGSTPRAVVLPSLASGVLALREPVKLNLLNRHITGAPALLLPPEHNNLAINSRSISSFPRGPRVDRG